MATGPRQSSNSRGNPGDYERHYHDAYLKLNQEEVSTARRAIPNATEADIVRYWEVKDPSKLGGQA
jgi:hypothetical protein